MSGRAVLHGAFVVTGDAQGRCFADGAVAVDGDRIAWTGHAADLPPRYRAWARRDLGGAVVMPGLINTHAHGGLSTHRGVCDEGDLFAWAARLAPHTSFLEAPDLIVGCHLAVMAMVASGTTCACDCTRYGAGIFSDVATTIGMRSLSGAMANSPELRPKGEPNWPRMADETRDAMTRHAGNPLARFYLGAHSPYSCTPDLLVEVKRAGERWGLGFNIHLAETRREVDLVLERYGLRPLEWLHDLGVLDDLCLLDHCVWLTEAEMDLLAERGAAVAHCPVSNAKLGSGVAPLLELLTRGVPVGLGTDSMLSNNAQNLFEEMKFSVLLQRASRLDAEILSNTVLLDLATLGGARALRWDGEIGSLEAGKQADLVVVDLEHPRGLTAERVLSDLVYACGPERVEEVMVAGTVIFEQGTFTQVDVDALAATIADRYQGGTP